MIEKTLEVTKVGHLTLRAPAEKHRELAIRSAEEGVSVNRFTLSRLY